MKISLFMMATAISTGVSSQAADWPNRLGPALNGISKETGWLSEWPAAGPKVLWKGSVGTGFSSFAVADRRVFTMGNENDQDSVVCLDAESGEELWRHTYPELKEPRLYEGGPNATPTVDGDLVYTLSRSGKLFCLHAQSGQVNWFKDLVKEYGIALPQKLHWGLSGSPLIQGEKVIVNAGRAGMAFEKDSGTLIWQTGQEPAAYATPVPFTSEGRDSVLVFAAKALVALDIESGEELWQYPWETSWDVNAADPIVSGNHILISSGYNHGAALLRVTDGKPEQVWENKNLRSQMNGGVLWQGHVYGVDENQLRCIDFQTGEVKWTDKSSGKGSVTLADGKLIVLSEKGELMVADASPESFSPLSRAQVLGGKCWTVPVLANGRIYARNAKGDVVCLGVTEKELTQL